MLDELGSFDDHYFNKGIVAQEIAYDSKKGGLLATRIVLPVDRGQFLAAWL
jgi:hypothetical protein